MRISGDAEAPPPPASLEIPSGTVLVVRMIDSVDSERDSTGKTFRASIDEPVVVNGQTVIPRGADVTAKLVDERQSGKFEGRAVLTLDLMQIMINGRMVDVTTSEVSQSSSSRGSRSLAGIQWWPSIFRNSGSSTGKRGGILSISPPSARRCVP